MSKKKQLFIQVLAFLSLVVGTTMYIIVSGEFSYDIFVIIILMVMFLVFFIPRFITGRNDLVHDDEYSKKLVHLASARSFIVSLYSWLVIMYFIDDFAEPSTAIGAGISIMAIIFFIFAIFYNFRGIKE